MPLRGIVKKAQDQGPRSYQEDFIVHIPFDLPHERGHLIGVFDGHGGVDAAKVCAAATPKFFSPNGNDDAGELLRHLVGELNVLTCEMQCGTTVSLACILETSRTVVTATLGDSPIVVRDVNGLIRTNNPHNVRSNESERRTAILRGGWYNDEDGYLVDANDRDGPGLQTTRGLGDRWLGKVLSREPEIETYGIGDTSAIIVGSDGLMEPERLNRYVRRKGTTDAKLFLEMTNAATQVSSARGLIDWRKSQDELDDNTSAIVWRPRRWWELF